MPTGKLCAGRQPRLTAGMLTRGADGPAPSAPGGPRAPGRIGTRAGRAGR